MSKKTCLFLSFILLFSLVIWAIVEGAQQYTLNVAKQGSGSGTVTSSPAGINCGSDCSEPYNQGTKITLKVKADPGSTFKGWSGGCTGTSPSCKLTMTSDQTVTATFGLPDLRGEWSGLSVKSSPAGYEVSGNLTVYADNAKANNVKANVYLSNDDTYDSNDIPLGSVTIGTINAGASKSKAFKYKGSNNPSGKCLIAVIDPDNTVKESNENNNTAVKCPPVANAGPDQTVFVTQVVTLDGSASSDIDGDPLTYQWSFVSRPEGSTAALSSPTAVNPSFTADKAGTYTVQLIVNDGTFDSAPDTVNIVAQPQVWSLEVGPEGGTLNFGNGVKLQIPPGAVSETTTISISDLVADQITEMLSNPSMTSTHTKRFLGGFSAKPDGLVFAVPIQAWVPISPLDLYETPVQVELLMSEQRYRYASSQLEYSGDEAMIKIEISHFSEEAFAGLTGAQIDALCRACGNSFLSGCEELDPLQSACCLIYPKDRAKCPIAKDCECCREKMIRVESIGVDLAFKGPVECQVLGSDIKVTFLDCKDSPTEKDSMSETSCKDLELEIKVEPAETTLCPCEEKQFEATVTGKKGGVTIFHDVSIDPIWTSDHPEIVEIDQSGKVIGKAISSTPVTIHAKVSASSSVKEGTAQVTVNWGHCTLEVTPSQKSMIVGDTLPLTATAKDATGNVIGSSLSGLPVSWSSSNTAVASVDQTGLVTAKGQGTATITATVEGMSGTANISVTAKWEEVRLIITGDPPCPTGLCWGMEKVRLIVTGVDSAHNAITGFHVNWSIYIYPGTTPNVTIDADGTIKPLNQAGCSVCIWPVITDDTGSIISCGRGVEAHGYQGKVYARPGHVATIDCIPPHWPWYPPDMLGCSIAYRSWGYWFYYSSCGDEEAYHRCSDYNCWQ